MNSVAWHGSGPVASGKFSLQRSLIDVRLADRLPDRFSGVICWHTTKLPHFKEYVIRLTGMGGDMAQKKRWLLVAMVVGLVALAITFAAAAVLAEGAVHRIPKSNASDTAALAYRVAQGAGGSAEQVFIAAQDGVRLDGWWLASPHPNGRATACLNRATLWNGLTG